MQLTCEMAELRKAVDFVRKQVDAKGTLPVLAAVKLTASDDVLTIEGTNLDTRARATVTAETKAPGETLVMAHDLAAFCRVAPKSKPVSMRAEGVSLNMVCGAANVSLSTMGVEDWPAERDAVEMADAPAGFADALAFCLPAAGAEETRYYLCGVNMDGECVVATDGNRLHWHAVDCGRTGIIPREVVSAIADMAGASGGQFGSDERKWSASAGAQNLTGKMIEGVFPDYRRVIPKDAPMVATADRDALAETAKQASLGDKAIIRIIGDAQGIVMKAAGLTSGGEMTARASSSCDAEINAAFEIGVNARYLLDSLSVMPAGGVDIHVQDNAILLLRPAGDESKLAVIMGARI